jgi:hypothetical protein
VFELRLARRPKTHIVGTVRGQLDEPFRRRLAIPRDGDAGLSDFAAIPAPFR